MKITTNHPASSYGVPVILDDDGTEMDYKEGVIALKAHLGLSLTTLAAAIGVSRATVADWTYGRNCPSARSLYALADLLARHEEAKVPP